MLNSDSKKPKVVHTYSKTDKESESSDEASGSVRKSSRIKAGIESGKINLATRTKLEQEEEIEEPSVSPKPKPVRNSSFSYDHHKHDHSFCTVALYMLNYPNYYL